MAQPTVVEVSADLHACPDCGYQNGFHVGFRRVGQAGTELAIWLICPSCSAVLDIGLRTKPKRPRP